MKTPKTLAEIKDAFRADTLEAVGQVEPGKASAVLQYLMGIYPEPLGFPDPDLVDGAQVAIESAINDLFDLGDDDVPGGILKGSAQLVEEWSREFLAEIETAQLERIPWGLMDLRE
jgi:hypothetical protein